jgi:uncharacterized protein
MIIDGFDLRHIDQLDEQIEAEVPCKKPLRIVSANNFLSRARGLLGRKQMKPWDGLYITRCNSIHTHFMRFPIDVIFLNERNECVRLIENLKPWRWAKESQAKHVLELSVGQGKQVFCQNGPLKDLFLDELGRSGETLKNKFLSIRKSTISKTL